MSIQPPKTGSGTEEAKSLRLLELKPDRAVRMTYGDGALKLQALKKRHGRSHRRKAR